MLIPAKEVTSSKSFGEFTAADELLLSSIVGSVPFARTVTDAIINAAVETKVRANWHASASYLIEPSLHVSVALSTEKLTAFADKCITQ